VPMGDLGRRTERSRVQSVDRAVSVLEALSKEQAGLGIVELSERVMLPVSSVHRLLATLGDRGFVSQNVATGHYRIGVRAFEVGSAFLGQSQLREIARPHIQELSSLTSETVNLALCDGSYATYVDQVHSQHPFQIVPRSGARVPLHCSGVGKVFLAGMTDNEFETYVATMKLEPWTKKTIVSVSQLRQHIDAVREQGFAFDDEEMHSGMRCVAAPIYDHRRRVSAAVSVVGPVSSMEKRKLPKLASTVRRVARVISEQLGYRSPGD
jgi:IclR family transcriptional regulator, KDG regulon repressor